MIASSKMIFAFFLVVIFGLTYYFGFLTASTIIFPPNVDSLSQQAHSDPYVLHSETEFCAPLRDYSATDPSHSILRFLHTGQPPYWVSVPVPDHVGLASSAIQSGGRISSGFDIFQTFVEDIPEDAIILDIGGHFGFAGLPIAATGRKVIAFEPVPSNQRLIKLGVCLNGFFDRYTLVLGAMGERDGNTTIYIPNSDWTDNAALSQSAATSSVGGTSTATQVRLFTLDSFAASYMTADEVARIGFIKVDVQGFETVVFRGGKRILSSLTSGTWIVAEHFPGLMNLGGFSPHNDIETLLPMGFTVHGERNGPELSPEQWDSVMDLWFLKK